MSGRARSSYTAAILLIAAAGLPTASRALPATPEPEMQHCIRAAAAGRRWLERTLWGLYDQEAGWTGAETRNRNGSFDLGPLQVNSQWVPTVAARMRRDRSDVRRWLRDDPCFNVGVSAWLFLSGYMASRNYWRAIGSYHSGDGERARHYAAQVADRLKRRYGALIFAR